MNIKNLFAICRAAALILPLCACSAPGHDDASAVADSVAAPVPATVTMPAYVEANWHFRIDAPSGWKIEHDFAHGYLADDAWKTNAASDSRGTPIVSLTVPGSNQITSAEIRIGASRDANEIAQCTALPDSVRAGSLHSERIDKAQFTTFEASDAAMSHYLDVKSFRAVHEGACYAIDLLVYGTNPQVYDPPPTPPFAKEQAFARMQAVLQTFRFTR